MEQQLRTASTSPENFTTLHLVFVVYFYKAARTKVSTAWAVFITCSLAQALINLNFLF